MGGGIRKTSHRGGIGGIYRKRLEQRKLVCVAELKLECPAAGSDDPAPPAAGRDPATNRGASDRSLAGRSAAWWIVKEQRSNRAVWFAAIRTNDQLSAGISPGTSTPTPR